MENTNRTAAPASREKRTTQSDSPLPHSLDIERNVLGAILLHVAGTDDAAQTIAPDDFFFAPHALIFRKIRDQLESGRRPDLALLCDALAVHGDIEKIPGGVGYVSGLIDGIPQICPLLTWVETIQQKAALRSRVHIAQRIQEVAFSSNGNAASAIEEIAILSLPLVQVAPKRDSRALVVSAKELLKMDVQPREFLLDGLLTKRSMAEAFSWRGVGKTWAALSAAHAIATGGSWLKWKASTPRPVLFVDGELDAASLQQRVRHLDAQANFPADKLRLLCCDMQDAPFPNLASRTAQIMIEDALGDSELLVLDNLSALAPASNDSEGEDWIAIQSWLLDLRRRGIACLFLHHAGHGGWARGTTRREDLLDLVIELRRPKDYVASEGLRLEIHFTKTRGMLADGAEPIEASLVDDLEGKVRWTWRPLEDKRAAQVVELRNQGKSFRDIEKLTDIPRSTAERLYQKAEASR